MKELIDHLLHKIFLCIYGVPSTSTVTRPQLWEIEVYFLQDDSVHCCTLLVQSTSKKHEQWHHSYPKTLVFAEEEEGKKGLCQGNQQWVERRTFLTWKSTLGTQSCILQHSPGGSVGTIVVEHHRPVGKMEIRGLIFTGNIWSWCENSKDIVSVIQKEGYGTLGFKNGNEKNRKHERCFWG